jgi:hypothetical protein
MPSWRDYQPTPDDNNAASPLGAAEGNYRGKWVNDTFRYMMAVIRQLGDNVPKLPDGGDPFAPIGGMAYQNPANVSITGGSIAGIGGVTPIRGIIAFGGTVEQALALEPQWALCDGRTVNGIATPNLRGRFVRGWSDTLAPGETGGMTGDVTSSSGGNHNHGGSTSGHALTVDQMPAHAHLGGGNLAGAGAGAGRTTPVKNPEGAGWLRPGSYGNQNDSWRWLTDPVGGGQSHTHGINSSGVHSHTVTVPPPPYFVLVYIMRTA